VAFVRRGQLEELLLSPKIYERLSKGEHTFKVRAIVADDNVDLTPAARTWRIVSKKR
jgi:hypothetical protein